MELETILITPLAFFEIWYNRSEEEKRKAMTPNKRRHLKCIYEIGTEVKKNQ